MPLRTSGPPDRFAAKLCNTPVALVNLVESERQRFLAHEGLPVAETETVPTSFCVHTMYGGVAMVVPDAAADERFAANAFVAGAPHIRFYAGYPLTSEEGVPLGALCVIDTEPRPAGRPRDETQYCRRAGSRPE